MARTRFVAICLMIVCSPPSYSVRWAPLRTTPLKPNGWNPPKKKGLEDESPFQRVIFRFQPLGFGETKPSFHSLAKFFKFEIRVKKNNFNFPWVMVSWQKREPKKHFNNTLINKSGANIQLKSENVRLANTVPSMDGIYSPTFYQKSTIRVYSKSTITWMVRVDLQHFLSHPESPKPQVDGSEVLVSERLA